MAIDVITPREEEKLLLHQALQGDRKAFGELVLLHQTRAMALATGWVGNREDARDLVQEACLKSFKALKSFRPRPPVFPLVLSHSAECLHSTSALPKGPASVSLQPADADGEVFNEPVDREAPLPEELVSRDEHSQNIGSALARMSAPDAEILVLKHFDGLSYKEIAEALAIPVGTVMSRLHAARRRLRKLVPELA